MRGASNTSFTSTILEGASNRGRASNMGGASIMGRGLYKVKFEYLHSALTDWPNSGVHDRGDLKRFLLITKYSGTIT